MARPAKSSLPAFIRKQWADIRNVAGRGRCVACGAEFATTTLYTPCACGSRQIERLAGEELLIKTMELEEAA
ncbi:MAG TPA: hydrogenase/urease maturation nickel metallochaperone HypA [Methyloceanibacter sp.]|nr:hydrogenase/urease maturation nickel metallochaperone HypA [Methyloceanibacter sp.]